MQEEKESEELQINIGEILRYLGKKWWILLITLIVCLAAGVFVGKSQKKVLYKSEANYAINYFGGSSTADTANGMNTITYSIGTLADCLQQDKFYDQVLKKTDESIIAKYRLTSEILGRCIYVTCSDTAETPRKNIIYITVITPYPDLSFAIADALSREYENEEGATTFLVKEYLSPLTAEYANGGQVAYFLQNNVKEAETPEPDSSVVKWTAICGGGGVVVCAVALGAVFVLDTRVKGSDDLTQRYNAAILGVIPDLYDKELNSLKYKN